MDAYFAGPPSLITEDQDARRVGVLNEHPQVALDVGGDLSACNAKLGSNLTVARRAAALEVDVSSNLKWGGHSLYEPCPQDPSDWDELIPFSGDNQGFIHTSWLRKPLTAKDVLTDLWNLAELGVDAAQVLADVYSMFDPQQALTQAMIEALKKALDSANDPASSNAIRVSWCNLLDKPVATVPGTPAVGVQGDLFVSDASGLKVLPGARFSKSQGNLQVSSTSGASPLLEYGTRTAHLDNWKMYASDGSSNAWISRDAPELRLKAWSLTGSTITCCNTPSNVAGAPVGLTWSRDSNQIEVSGGRLLCVNPLVCQSLVQTNKVIPFSGSGPGDLTFSNTCTRIRHLDDGPAGESGSGYVTLYRDTLEFETQAATSNTGIKPKVLQWSADSNGMVFVRSNVLFPNRALLRAYQTPGIDTDVYREGRFSVSPDGLGLTTFSNNYEQAIFAVNSNGVFPLRRCSIFGSNETFAIQNPADPLGPPQTLSNYARLDISMSNGLVYGSGLSNNQLGASTGFDVFAVDRTGQISVRQAASGLMKVLVDSNADLVRGAPTSGMRLDNAGRLMVNGQPVVTETGAIMRRADSNDTNAGLLVSPTGFLQVGKFNCLPDGSVSSQRDIATACNVTASNATACNLVAMRAVLGPTGALLVSSNYVRVAYNATLDARAITSASTCGITLSNATNDPNTPALQVTNYTNGTNGMNYLFVTPSHDGAGVGHVRIGTWGYANFGQAGQVGTGPQPIHFQVPVGVGHNMSNPSQDLHVRSNAAVGGSFVEAGAALSNKYALSNALAAASNALYPSAAFGSNAGGWGSNQAAVTAGGWLPSSNLLFAQGAFASNAGAWGSNLSPSAAFGSNAGAWSSNQAASTSGAWLPSSNLLFAQGNFASNAGAFSSNQLPSYRKTADAVPWASISGKPDFDSSTNALGIAGVTLGAAGLLFGGYQLLNNNGQLASALASAAGSLQITPSGYGRFKDMIDIGDSLDPALRISLNANGFMSAPGAKFGLGTIHLSNDIIRISSNAGAFNTVYISSNLSYLGLQGSVGIGLCNPAYKLDVVGQINASSNLLEAGVPLQTKYALSNAVAGLQSNLVGGSATFARGVTACNLTALGTIAACNNGPWPDHSAVLRTELGGGTWYSPAGSSSNPVWLAQWVNSSVDPASNQLLGGILLRSYNAGGGTAPYGFPDRQLVGMGFVCRNGLASNAEALTISHLGRVGVGVSNPSSNLQVAGDAWVTGQLGAAALAQGGCNISSLYAPSNALAGTSNALFPQGLFASNTAAFASNAPPKLWAPSGAAVATNSNVVVWGGARLDAPVMTSGSAFSMTVSNAGGNQSNACWQLTNYNYGAGSNGMNYMYIIPQHDGWGKNGCIRFGSWGYCNLGAAGQAGTGPQPFFFERPIGIGVSNPSADLVALSNVAAGGSFVEGGAALSNRYATSNALAAASNALFPAATWSSNAALWSSNQVVALGGAGTAAPWASNLAAATSNKLYPWSNLISPSVTFASNAGGFGSNTAAAASNQAYGAVTPPAYYQGGAVMVVDMNTILIGSGISTACNVLVEGNACFGSGGTNAMIYAATGNIQTSGSLTASSKSFVIPHPLQDKTHLRADKHSLVHACIEAPQADLVYSGRVTLEKGRAAVEIDSASCPFSPMTRGTFEALTRNPRVFLQNMDGFTAVRGNVVAGGLLEIAAQNRGCEDDVCWMVVAERKDAGLCGACNNMFDRDGHLITEV